MTDLLANLLVVCIVVAAVCYAAYAFGPAKFRTWLLAQVGRIFGLRALTFLLRHSRAGCGDCAAAGSHHPAGMSKQPVKPVR